jgi:thiamine biosynthesis protein ThiI
VSRGAVGSAGAGGDVGQDASQLVLVRFSGDITIKARGTRFQFVRRLLSNLRDALESEGIPPRIQLSHNRMLVELPDPGALPVLARVFGVQSLSRVEKRVPTELPAIVEAGVECFRERVAGKRFAVRARRVGDRARIPVSAHDVELALGTALLPFAAGVDLGHPEVTVGVELLERATYLFSERSPGFAGLPLGVEGRAVALFSGGFDSAVAAWHLLKRGVALDYVFCNLGGQAHLQGVLRVARILACEWSHGDRPSLHVVDFAPIAAELQARTAKRFWQVLLKRQLLRAAERVAAAGHAVAIVTGDSVGQVSSQTLQNLAVISRATAQPILRPLVGFNKDEIIAVAERIGTFELSKVVGEYCDLAARRPATSAALAAVEAEETGLDPALLERAVAERVVYDLRGLDESRLGFPELEIERIPPDAVVLDLSPREAYQRWHWEGALRLDFPQAIQAYPSFDPARQYVIYCEFGLQSAFLAERMRKAGLEAFHVRGGSRALRRLASP